MWEMIRRYAIVGAGSASVVWAAWDISGLTVRQVTGRSMQPTLNPDYYNNIEQGKPKRGLGFMNALDWVLVVKSNGSDVTRGDIVTIFNPIAPSDRDIKRVVATENQVVRTRSYKNRTVTVPKSHLWLEGDNHSISKDSNAYGPIPRSLVFGRAVAVVFPPWRWSLLKSEPPQTNFPQVNASESRFEEDKD